jgi:hypothetical protein
MASLITANGLRAKWTGKDVWLADPGARGDGRLLARITRKGVFFYFQYFAPDARKRLFALGPFDVQGEHGLSLAAARTRSSELSKLYRSGVTDIHAHFEQQRVANEEQQKHAALAREAGQAVAAKALLNAKRFSLRNFLHAYVDHLERAGKPSHKDVANIFKNHVFVDAELRERAASLVSTDEFVSLIGKVVAAGHGRTAAKLRSYLHAAYALGIRAKTNPAAPQLMRDFALKVNPWPALTRWHNSTERSIEILPLQSSPPSSSACAPSRSMRSATLSRCASTWEASVPHNCSGCGGPTLTSRPA